MFYSNGVNQRAINILILVLVVLSFASMSSGDWLYLLLTLPPVIIAITFHEFAHAYAADRLGDTTPRNQGRLSLNPIAHLDLMGFILMMFAHIGWGKPVQVNPSNFNSNKSRAFCETMVSLAGPLMNFFLALISCIAYVILSLVGSSALLDSNVGLVIMYLLSMLITVNIGLGVFNLIPLPPLDGEKIFKNILPSGAKSWLTRNGQMLEMLFLILWITGLLGEVVSPVINVVYTLIKTPIGYLFGLFL